MLYEEKEKPSPRPHNVIMEDRARLSVTGVTDVESFDDRQIVARTSKGSLIIRGGELHIDQLSLDSGELAVTGLITDLGYEETAPGGSLWSRLFK
ncbi:MAG: sporulation protein YabP [Oscillospiraceae bacterium]|jgi:sporulation protein YabP|nr:sporulation protein YabP [Oscillospiraceae bacterium]